MTGNIDNRLENHGLTSTATAMKELLLVAQGLHALDENFCSAVYAQNADELVALARRHLSAGAQALAVNLGPNRIMTELLPWVAETLLRELPARLFISANALTNPELLGRHGSRLTINAVTADPASLPHALATARECGTSLVVLLVRPGLTPGGSNDRLELAAEVIDQAVRLDFPLHRLYLDPLLSMRPDPVARKISRGLPDIAPVAETIHQISQIEEVHTIVALDNWSSGVDRAVRTDLQGRILELLVEAGLDTVILNGKNRDLLHTCQRLSGDRGVPPATSRAA